MATVHITFSAVTNIGEAALLPKVPRAVQTMTSSGTSAASTITAKKGEVANIVSSGGAIYVAIGASPTAASGSGYLVETGERLVLSGLQTGDKVAIKDV